MESSKQESGKLEICKRYALNIGNCVFEKLVLCVWCMQVVKM